MGLHSRWVVGLLVAVGCGVMDDGGDAGSAAVVTDSAGVIFVANAAVGEGDRTATIVKVRSIGVVEGDDEYQLHQVRALAVAADGTFFAGVNAAETVRVFGPDGRFIRAFARRGRGPGEFLHVQSLALIGDSVLAVGYSVDQRSAVFDRDGTLLFIPPAAVSDMGLFIIGADAEGWIGLSPSEQLPTRRTRPLAAGEVWPLRMSVVRLAAEAPERHAPLHTFELMRLRWNPVAQELVFGLFDPIVLPDGDGRGGVYMVRGPGYRIEILRAGRLERVVTRAHTPRFATEDDYAALRQRIEERDPRVNWPGSGPPVDTRPHQLESLAWRWSAEEAHPLPALRHILAGADGSFWVERTDLLDALAMSSSNLAVMDPRPDGSRWDLFDAEGAYRATVDLPPRFIPLDVRGDEVTGVQMDALDVEFIVTYRVDSNGSRDRG